MLSPGDFQSSSRQTVLVERMRGDLLLLIGLGLGATIIGCVLVILWMRIIRNIWPSRTAVLSIAVGLLGITVLSVLTYIILEH